MRFQNQNFGYGYPILNDKGEALCPYCSSAMDQTLDDAFPPEWREETPRIEPEDAPA